MVLTGNRRGRLIADPADISSTIVRIRYIGKGSGVIFMSLSKMTPDPLMLVLVLVFQPCDDGRIGKRRRVAERLTFGDVAQEPPHDLSRARLR